MDTSPYCTIGPFFPGEFVTGCEDLTSFQGKRARGEHVVLTGRVLEEGNRPILNAIVEIWQPDAAGVFRHPLDPRVEQADPGFIGWGGHEPLLKAATRFERCCRARVTVTAGRTSI